MSPEGRVPTASIPGGPVPLRFSPTAMFPEGRVPTASIPGGPVPLRFSPTAMFPGDGR
jgi:hypothetical protein